MYLKRFVYDRLLDWKNEGGLKDQYYCHTQLAKTKSSWNLEPWRPNVSLAKTIAKACNP